MKNKIKISKELALPIDAVTQTLATIGRKGAGKTYLASMIAEQMLDVDAQIVVIDPVGNWWGLRVGTNGKTKGKDIFIIGGDHGDVPLVPEAGAQIARLIVEKNIPVVLDVSGFRLGERKRFAADFGEELLHLKKKARTPVHVFIEEAQLFIPQRVGPEEARMVGAFEQIVRLGRNYGIGATLITQRPQSVNKEVLSQVECLCVLQVTGPHERKALTEWVQEVGADRKLVGELPGLERGEGYIWSPSWLRLFERVHFGKKTTFDASATPEVGKASKAAKLSSVDVDQLRKNMSEIVEQAEKDDPKKLRKRIAQLERDLSAKQPTEVREVKKVVIAGPSDYKKISHLVKRLEHISPRFETLQKNWLEAKTEIDNLLQLIENSKIKPKTAVVFQRPDTKVPIAHIKSTSDVQLGNQLTGPEQRVLDALAWCETIGIVTVPNELAAFLSGYSHARSTGYTNPRGYLKTKGLVEYNRGKVFLTETGRDFAVVPEKPLTQEELHKIVLDKLPGPEQRVLSPLLEAYPDHIDNYKLCQLAGYSHERSTGYTNPRGKLRTYGLVEYVPDGVRACDFLFL